MPRPRARFPAVPDRVRRGAETLDAREFAVVVGAMAAIVGATSTAGRVNGVNGGRSPACQAALSAFGLHGLVHLAQAAAVRGYAPGSATSPLLVVPFAVSACGRLRRAGVLRPARRRDVVAGACRGRRCHCCRAGGGVSGARGRC